MKPTILIISNYSYLGDDISNIILGEDRYQPVKYQNHKHLNIYQGS